MDKGVAGFWLRAMLNNPEVSKMIQEKDRPILVHLKNVECILHEDDFGYDVHFHFSADNGYFSNTTLTKSFKMVKSNIIEEAKGTEIQWVEGKDVTKKKVKKKQHNKKTNTKRTITKVVPQE